MLMSMRIFKRGAWLQLESMNERYDSIKTLVMLGATSTNTFIADGQDVMIRLLYPVHATRYYHQRSPWKV